MHKIIYHDKVLNSHFCLYVWWTLGIVCDVNQSKVWNVLSYLFVILNSNTYFKCMNIPMGSTLFYPNEYTKIGCQIKFKNAISKHEYDE